MNITELTTDTLFLTKGWLKISIIVIIVDSFLACNNISYELDISSLYNMLTWNIIFKFIICLFLFFISHAVLIYIISIIRRRYKYRANKGYFEKDYDRDHISKSSAEDLAIENNNMVLYQYTQDSCKDHRKTTEAWRLIEIFIILLMLNIWTDGFIGRLFHDNIDNKLVAYILSVAFWGLATYTYLGFKKGDDEMYYSQYLKDLSKRSKRF